MLYKNSPDTILKNQFRKISKALILLAIQSKEDE